MPRIKVPDKLLPFLEKEKRFKVAFGGRGGAKSQSYADMSLMLARLRGARFGCFREFQNSIEDSVHSLLKREIQRLHLKGFKVYNKTIDCPRSGGMFRFRGLARNIDSAKSMDGFTNFWVEEAQSVSEESLKILTPTLREAGSEIWFSLNPMSSADPISQRFLEPFMDQLQERGFYEDDLHYIVKVNYMDNPWFPEVLEMERQYDYEHLSRAEYNHIWLGDYNDHVENAIIPAEWFDAAVDAHIKLGIQPRGEVVVSHDPSDSGDARGRALRHGIAFLAVDENDTDDVNDACDWALDLAIQHKADRFIWDCDGLGISLKRQVNTALEGKKIDPVIFKGSQEPARPKEVYQGPLARTDKEKEKTNKETFKNRRAQHYWYLRDRFYKTYCAVVKGQYIDPDELISLSSDIVNLPGLRSEVCRVPRRPNGAGLIQIMTKDEMRTKNIKSPNRADCLMMNLYEGPRRTGPIDIPYQGWGH